MAEAIDNTAVNEASGDAADIPSVETYHWHQPIISQRKPGSTRAVLRRWRDLKAIYLNRRLDPVLREEIMISVADADTSRQCSFAHHEWALAEGISDAELAALEGGDVEFFDARKLAAIVWTHEYASTDFTSVPDVIDADFRQQYSAQEQADIELAARTMYWLNEISNGTDAFYFRLKGKPVPEGHAGKEFQAALVYILVVPFLLIYLAIRRRHRLVAEVRSMGPFFVAFEERKRKKLIRWAKAGSSRISPPPT